MTQQNGLDINNQEQNKEKLTHFNEAGEAHMVDVHAKDDTYRVAKACGTIKVNDAVYRAAVSYTHLTLPTILNQCRSRWSPYH